MEISSDENILLTLGWRFLIIKFRSSVAAHQIVFFFLLLHFLTCKAFGGFLKFPNDFFKLSILFIVIVVLLLFFIL